MIRCINYRDVPDEDSVVINVTSRSTNWSKGLSPFLIKPIGEDAQNVENFWQYSRVFNEHVDENGEPNESWYKWRDEGFKKKLGDRYPMGKGAKPLYSFYKGNKYGYIEARKKMYAPVYAKSVVMTRAYEELYKVYKNNDDIYLLDFDCYDNEKLGMTMKDVINCETRKMGHCFVLKNMLIKDIKPYTKLNFL